MTDYHQVRAYRQQTPRTDVPRFLVDCPHWPPGDGRSTVQRTSEACSQLVSARVRAVYSDNGRATSNATGVTRVSGARRREGSAEKNEVHPSPPVGFFLCGGDTRGPKVKCNVTEQLMPNTLRQQKQRIFVAVGCIWLIQQTFGSLTFVFFSHS